MTNKDVFDEVRDILNGRRDDHYGDHERESERIGAIWTVLLNGKDTIDGDMVDLFMVALKMVRQSTRYKRDNLLDMIGYPALTIERHDRRDKEGA